MACKITRSHCLRILRLGIFQEQAARKATRDGGRIEKEHHGRSGSKFSHHAAKRDAEFSEKIAGNEVTTMDATSKTLYKRSELL